MNTLKKFLDISSSLLSKRDYKLDQYAINLINNDFKGYVNLVAENNFIPNNSIFNHFNNKINQFISQDDLESYNNIEYAINKINYKISNEQALSIFNKKYHSRLKISKEDLLFSTFEERIYNFSKKHFSYKLSDNLINQLVENIKKPEFQNSIFNKFIKSIDNYKKPLSSEDKWNIIYENKHRDIIYNLLQSYLILDYNQFKKINITSYLQLFTQFKNAINSLKYDNSKYIDTTEIIEHFINNRDVIYNNEVNTLVSKSKIQFLGQSANISAKEKLELNFKEKLNSSFLPKSSLDILNKIQNKYESILTSNPNQTYIDNADKIIQEFLPNVINKYLSIDKDYIKTMKNSQGQNAEDLLIESLNSIHTMLSNDLEIIQNHNLTNLSANNRFLKAKI